MRTSLKVCILLFVLIIVLQEVKGYVLVGNNVLAAESDSENTLGMCITGSSVIATGKYNTYSVEINLIPAAANAFTWSIEPVNTMVKVNTSGKVTVSKNAAIGDYVLKAVAKDGSGRTAVKKIKIVQGAIKTIKLKAVGEGEVSATNRLTKTLFRVPGPAGAQCSMRVMPVTTGTIGYDKEAYEFTSSNTSIVTVNQEGYISVTGNGTGSATIKCITTDGSRNSEGSRLSASVVVKVINPASGLMLKIPENRSNYVAKGKTIRITPVFETAYGALNSKNLKWKTSDTSLATVIGSGIVTMKCHSFEKVTITAICTDGSGVNASYVLYGSTPIKNMSFGNVFYNKANPKYTFIKNVSDGTLHVPISFNQVTGGDYEKLCTCPHVLATSSAPDVLAVSQPKDGYILMTPKHASDKKVKITLKTLDGTGVSHTWYFKVGK